MPRRVRGPRPRQVEIAAQLWAPLILILAAFGGYAAEGSYFGMLMTFVFGGLGFAMVRFGFDRICLLLGFILGIVVEQYFYVAIRTRGISFVLDPIPLVLEAVLVLVLCSDWLRSAISKRVKKT